VQRLSRNQPLVLLVAALLLALVMTLVLTASFSFYQDTWAFLINRRHLSADALFEPHNEHLVVFAVVIEWLLVHVFGMDSALPEYVLLAIVLAATAALLFVYLRKRIGDWLALFATLVLLTLGPAWEVLMWPFEITFLGPILFGLAMLLALEREDRRGDVAACAFLILAIGFSGAGICFMAGALAAVLMGPRQTWFARAYIFVIPLLLYVAWWLGWGHDAESHISINNLAEAPVFVASSIAWALQSMLGLGPQIGSEPDFAWGKALFVGLVVVLGYRQWRYRPGFDRWLWPAAAAAFANWFLTALNAFPGRDPSSSRYQYAGVIFVFLVLANLFKGVRPSRTVLTVFGTVTVLVVGSNLVILKQGRDVQKAQSVITRADTAAIEIASRTVPPEFELTEPVAGTPSLINIYAGPYLEAVDELGSPAYSEAELANAPELGRRQADIVLAQALPLSTVTTLGADDGNGEGKPCVTVPGGGKAVPEVSMRPGETRIELASGPSAEISLRRFAVAEYPVKAEEVTGDSVTILRVPRDHSPRPWQLHVEARQPARVCR
jgi:hypothetical protein